MATRAEAAGRGSLGRRRGWALVGVVAVLVALVCRPAGAAAQTRPSDPPTTASPPTTPAPPTTTASTTTTAPPSTTPTTEPPPAPPAPPGAPSPPTTVPGAPGSKVPPPTVVIPDPTPEVHALLATLKAMDAEKLVPFATHAVAEKQAGAQTAADEVADAKAGLTAARRAVAASRSRLSGLAVAAYVQPQDQDVEELLGRDTAGRRTVMLKVALQNEKLRLAAAKRAVSAAEKDLTRARLAAKAANSNVNLAQQSAQQLQQHIDDLHAEAVNALASGATGPDAWQLSIEGDSEFTAPELAAWFASRHVTSLAGVPVATLAKYYIDEGKEEHVRGDVAFAQAIIETGSFTNDDTVRNNNYAGIGHCDSCATGFHFRTPQLGVRAQIQLLKSYAEVFPTYQHPLVDPRLKGPAGCCPSWNRLTRVWATDPNYGPVILTVYEKMLEWLIVERGGTVPSGA